MTNDQNDKRKIIATLLAYWPIAGETKQDAKEAVAMFETALEGVSPRFVEQSVKAFIQGRVPTHNPSFRPKPTELAAHARPLQIAHLDRQERLEAQRLQFENSGREEPTAEEKAVIQNRLEEFHRSVAQCLSMDPVSAQNSTPAKYPNAEETRAVLEKYYGGKP